MLDWAIVLLLIVAAPPESSQTGVQALKADSKTVRPAPVEKAGKSTDQTPSTGNAQNRSSKNDSSPQSPSGRTPVSKTINLRDALVMTASQSMDARVARLEQEKVSMEGRMIKRKFYPLIKVEANALFWNDSLYMNVELSPQLVQMMQNMGVDASMPPMKIRGQKTAQGTVTVVQPITPLLMLREYYRSKMSEIAALKSDEKVKIRLLKKEVVKAYFNCLKAEAYEQVLVDAGRLLDEQERRVRALVEEKVAIAADIRTVQLARSEVDAQRSRIALSKVLARQYFTYLIGGDPKQPYTPQPVKWTVDRIPQRAACMQHAKATRPEFRMIAHRLEQIRHGRKAMFWNGVPKVMVVGSYQHNEGFGPIYPDNAFFVGAVLKWDFQWNSEGLEQDKLGVMARKMQVQQEKIHRLITLEISRHYSSMKEHEAMLLKSAAAVRKARANYEDTVARYKEGVAVLSDVLDARVSLTRAQVQRVTTEYDIMNDRALYLLACGMEPVRAMAE